MRAQQMYINNHDKIIIWSDIVSNINIFYQFDLYTLSYVVSVEFNSNEIIQITIARDIILGKILLENKEVIISGYDINYVFFKAKSIACAHSLPKEFLSQFNDLSTIIKFK